MTGTRRLPRPQRATLPTLQLVCGVWTTWALLALVLAPAAAADNCSVFSDCFGVTNSAAKAAFGLSLLAVLSLVLDFVPFVGTGKGVIEAVSGRDLITGEELAPWERALGVLPYVGKVGRLAKVGRGLDDVGALSRVGRHLDDVDDLGDVRRIGGTGRHADDVPTRPTHPKEGVGFPLSAKINDLLLEYRKTGVTTKERVRLSEELGEEGALQYARKVLGDDALELFKPGSPADVAGLVTRIDNGQAWDRAVVFGGRNATNVIYYDGKTLHIIEAKGGSGRYSDRTSTFVDKGTEIKQKDPQYPRDVAYDMTNSPKTDGRHEIGDVIEKMYEQKQVRYVGVRTGPYTQLVSGTPRITVQQVFLEPTP